MNKSYHKNVKAGNCLFQVKKRAEYLADSFHFETHIITNEVDFVIHSGSVSGLGIDITEETTAAIEADNGTNGHFMTIKNIEQIYIDVECSRKQREFARKNRII